LEPAVKFQALLLRRTQRPRYSQLIEQPQIQDELLRTFAVHRALTRLFGASKYWIVSIALKRARPSHGPQLRRPSESMVYDRLPLRWALLRSTRRRVQRPDRCLRADPHQRERTHESGSVLDL